MSTPLPSSPSPAAMSDPSVGSIHERASGGGRGAGSRAVGWVLTVAVVTGGWVAGQRWPDQITDVWRSVTDAVSPASGGASSGGAVDTAPLIPVDGERDHPTAGHEEAGAPLGMPPTVPDVPGGYAFSQTQTDADGVTTPVAWSPCRPIHYVVDLTGAPTAFHEEVRAAAAEMTAATGLVFVDDGVVSEAPDVERPAYLPSLYGDRWAPVLVRFADGTTVPDLAGAVAGVAAPVTATDPGTGRTHAISGAVYIDTETLTAPDTGGDPRHVLVLRHELAHLVGLAHVDDRSQLMYPETTDLTTFQDGDRAGLAALGRGACAPGV